MPSELVFYSRPIISLSDPASERPIFLHFAWREDYLGYYYFVYAPASGRCFTLRRFGQE